jgi:hypothetical protein
MSSETDLDVTAWFSGQKTTSEKPSKWFRDSPFSLNIVDNKEYRSQT